MPSSSLVEVEVEGGVGVGDEVGIEVGVEVGVEVGDEVEVGVVVRVEVGGSGLGFWLLFRSGGWSGWVVGDL